MSSSRAFADSFVFNRNSFQRCRATASSKASNAIVFRRVTRARTRVVKEVDRDARCQGSGNVSFAKTSGVGRAFMTISKRECDRVSRAREAQGMIDRWLARDGGVAAHDAVAKYVAATAFEIGAIALVLSVGQKVVLDGLYVSNAKLAKAIVAVMFFVLAFRSRAFSPLNASRPKIENERAAKRERRRPAWTPPAVVFPIVWISMGFLRALSTMVVFGTTGTVMHPAVLSLVAHLSIGDTWNSINNVEKRLGVAAVGVLFVVSSSYNVVAQYYKVIPTAGYMIAPLAVWLTIASVLVWNIWLINDKQPLYPTKPRKFANAPNAH